LLGLAEGKEIVSLIEKKIIGITTGKISLVLQTLNIRMYVRLEKKVHTFLMLATEFF
jgi:hypothetical protein